MEILVGNLNNVRFADDIVLFRESANAVNNL